MVGEDGGGGGQIASPQILSLFGWIVIFVITVVNIEFQYY